MKFRDIWRAIRRFFKPPRRRKPVSCPTTGAADFNGDGVFDADDYK